MSNSSPKKPKPKKQRLKAADKPQKWSAWKAVRVFTTLLITILGLPSAAVFFLPRVAVSVSDPVDPNNAFSSTVTVTNTGYIPLENVRMLFAVETIRHDPKFPSVNFEGAANLGTRLEKGASTGHYLSVDDVFQAGLSDFMQDDGSHIQEAKIGAVVTYEVPVIGWKREKVFPFNGRRETNGKLYWQRDTVDH